MRFSAGARLGRFEVQGSLGKGGMGEVYRARDVVLGRQVAIKVLHEDVANDPQRIARFEREAQAVARLSHPSILAIHDLVDDDGVTFVVMELLEGESLRQRLNRSTISWRESVAITIEICDGLASAHGKGVIHRDLKPENIFLTGESRAKILDFGLARFEEPVAADSGSPSGETWTAPGTVLGTMGYMAPEQLRGNGADARSDLFAVGCVLFEMLTGKRAFEGITPVDVLAAVLRGQPPELREHGLDVPRALDLIVARCLDRKPERRFQSASDLAFALRALLSNADTGDGDPTPWDADAGLDSESEAASGVVVVDFINMTHDSEADWLCAGIAETITADFKRISALKTVSRPTTIKAMEATGAAHSGDKELFRLGRMLGVRWIVSGAFQKVGEALRITARFLDTVTQTTLDTCKVDGRMADVFALQDEIVAALAKTLDVVVRTSEMERIEQPETTHLKAYEHCARARQIVNSMSMEAFPVAIDHLQKAIELDPDYSLAYSALGAAHTLRYIGAIDPGDLIRSVEYLEKALELDESLADPLIWLTYAYSRQGEFDKAVASGERAIGLEPDNPVAHYMLGAAHYLKGISDAAGPGWSEAVAAFQRATELSPRMQVAYQMSGDIYLRHGDYDRAREVLTTAAEIECSGDVEFARFVGAQTQLGRLLHRCGDRRGALEQFDRSLAALKESRHAYQPASIALTLCGKGDLLLEERHDAEALSSFRQASEHAEQHRRSVASAWHLIRASLGMAKVFHRLGMRREEAAQLDHALDLLRNLELLRFNGLWECGEAEMMYEVAAYHALARNQSEAIEWLQRAVANGWREIPRLGTASEFKLIAEDSALRAVLLEVEAEKLP